MKIYFAGSIRGGREDVDLYMKIINHLTTYGEVLTEHIGDQNLTQAGEIKFDENFIYNRDMDRMLSADLIVAEVSTPSLGVGYEIGQAVAANKDIICLYRKGSPKQLSAMICGCQNLKVLEYSDYDEVVDFLSKNINK